MPRLSLFLALLVACTTPSHVVRAPAPAQISAVEPQDPVDPPASGYAELIGPVDELSVLPAMAALEQTPAELLLVIDSPGGYVSAGLELIKSMQNAQRAGTHVTCVVEHMAASMAAVILESCDARFADSRAAILFHTVSVSEAEGNAWDLERLAQKMRALNHRLAILITGRMFISIQEYEEIVADYDWWLSANEALAVGALDGVL